MEKAILREESALTAGTSFVLGLISLQYVWRNGALGAVNFVRVSEGVARTRWWPRKPHQPRVQLATAPALATHNNLKNRIRLQARRGRWGRTTVREKLAKAPPLRRAHVFPYLTSCLWALPIFQKMAFRWRIDRIETALPSLLVPFPSSRFLDRRARVFARHHFRDSICYVCLEWQGMGNTSQLL